MTMHKVLHPRDYIDRLYVLRKEGGRGLPTLKIASMQLEDYLKKHGGRLIIATRNSYIFT